VLREASLGTLLFDLLTAAEDRDYATRFDIALLTSRLLAATQYLADAAVLTRVREVAAHSTRRNPPVRGAGHAGPGRGGGSRLVPALARR